MFWKYAANLQKNTHVEVRFQIEITLQQGRFPVNLLHIFRTSFSFDTSVGLLLCFTKYNLPAWCQFFNVFEVEVLIEKKPLNQPKLIDWQRKRKVIHQKIAGCVYIYLCAIFIYPNKLSRSTSLGIQKKICIEN